MYILLIKLIMYFSQQLIIYIRKIQSYIIKQITLYCNSYKIFNIVTVMTIRAV